MKKNSAGILLYRFNNGRIQFFLMHPGGPYYMKKDQGVWSIPKGEFDESEDSFLAAKREFYEETGQNIEMEKVIELNPSKTKSGKIIHAWAVESDIDHVAIRSNNFTLEWPPKSGNFKEFPEMDKAEWFNTDTAKIKIHQSQLRFIEQLLVILS
jgi:predicted NUDIX family NTP pyrophosphohydrolase